MFKDKILKIINKNKLVKKSGKVLIAVSGGPDSIALLYIFHELRNELELSLHAAHFNHCFRGKESDDDMIFVKKLCKKLSIPCTIGTKDIPKILAQNKSISSQELSRNLRYEFFKETCLKQKCNILSTGHNLNDQTETIFLHLLRGCGTAGLIGMQILTKINNGLILIRPFLNITRNEIETFLKENNYKYREDSSNFSDHYLRNHLRLHLLPKIRKKYNTNIDNSLLRLSKILNIENDYLSEIVKNEFDKIVKKQNERFSIDISLLKKLHPCIRKRIIREVLMQLKGNINAITYEHTDSIENLVYQSLNKKIDLPDNYIARREYNKLFFEKKEEKFEHYEYIIPVPSNIYIPVLEKKIKISISKNKHNFKKIKVEIGKDSAFFSFSEIPENFILRNRLAGDRFIPDGMKGTKKLKKFFIDLKIPISERDKIPLLLFKNEIIWIAGYRQNKKYKLSLINQATTKISM